MRRLPIGQQASRPGFVVVPPQSSGIAFTNVLSEDRSLTNTIVNNGSGLALGDVDGDGLCDIYFCSLDGCNALYRNLGEWRFEDITRQAGVVCCGQLCTGAVLVDVDGDGDLDLLVNAIGRGTRLFINDGHAHFHEKLDSGLTHRFGSTSIALADIDGDGDLDLYVANYRTSTILDEPNTRFTLSTIDGKLTVTKVNGLPTSDPEISGRFAMGPTGSAREVGEPDMLYLNDGTGRFTLISDRLGTFSDDEGRPIPQPLDWGLSVMFRDLNGDGAPDIYVCNDGDSPDRVWMNDGTGKFRALPSLAFRHTSLSSMGVDCADVDRDGFDDIFVLDMLARSHQKRLAQLEKGRRPHAGPGVFENQPQYTHNTLSMNRGDGTYAEVAYAAGLHSSDWSWTPIFLDVDLDGFEDLLIATGFVREVEDIDVADRIRAMKARQKLSTTEELKLRRLFPKWETPNIAFRNQGGLGFKEIGKEWGFDWVGVSQGMALGDLDGDGYLDVVANNLNGPGLLCRNVGGAGRVAVRLKGKGGNTRGIGAKILLFGGAVPKQSQEVMSGGRYLSGDEAIRVFATGTHTNGMRLEVLWRRGGRSVIEGVEANCEYEIDEQGASPSGAAAPAVAAAGTAAGGKPVTLFEDATVLLKHRHVENSFDDFERQPLLPRRLSQGGPGVAWMDVDGDGKEDLVIGSGTGGSLGVLVNRGGTNGFARVGAPVWQAALTEDLAGVVGWSSESGSSTMFVAKTSYESGRTNGPAVVRYDVFFGEVKETVIAEVDGSSVGPLALADFDGDGDLDLFVGGQVVPGMYPKAASSRLFRNDAGKYVPDLENSRVLAEVGLVNGAVWTDLDADGLPELVLACDWGCVRVFANQGGQLHDATEQWGTKDFRGWWTGVAAGDFDGDGRMDLVAGNWGVNTKYREHLGRELRVYHGDVDADGRWEVVEAHWDPELEKEVPWADWRKMKAAVPYVGERFASYGQYARAGVEEVFGADLAKMRQLKVNVLDTTVFLNRGGHFEAKSLPMEAQLAPVFGVGVGDVDGDGNEDLLLSQNFFATDEETGRYDAGRGLILKGDGRGGFQSMKGQESGVIVYGEQRGSAVGDFDEDGRLDWVVSQNGSDTRLLHNVGGRQCLRVRLVGAEGNRVGIGCVVRLGDGKVWGAAREVHGGSGYLSQDSVVQLMSNGGSASQIQVRWPGGRITTGPVPASAKEIQVHSDGQIETIR